MQGSKSLFLFYFTYFCILWDGKFIFESYLVQTHKQLLLKYLVRLLREGVLLMRMTYLIGHMTITCIPLVVELYACLY